MIWKQPFFSTSMALYVERYQLMVNHAEKGILKDIIFLLTCVVQKIRWWSIVTLHNNWWCYTMPSKYLLAILKWKKLITLKKQRSTRDADISAANPPVTGASWLIYIVKTKYQYSNSLFQKSCYWHYNNYQKSSSFLNRCFNSLFVPRYKSF